MLQALHQHRRNVQISEHGPIALLCQFGSSANNDSILPGQFTAFVLDGTTLQLAGSGVSQAGRARMSIRLIASLLYFKHAYNLGHEEVHWRAGLIPFCIQ